MTDGIPMDDVPMDEIENDIVEIIGGVDMLLAMRIERDNRAYKNFPFSFSSTWDTFREIRIDGHELGCVACEGPEYVEASSGLFKSGFPFQPYKITRVLELEEDDSDEEVDLYRTYSQYEDPDGFGFPFDDFDDYEVSVMEPVAYLIDAKDIVWVYNRVEGLFERPTMQDSFMYIRHYDPKMFYQLAKRIAGEYYKDKDKDKKDDVD